MFTSSFEKFLYLLQFVDIFNPSLLTVNFNQLFMFYFIFLMSFKSSFLFNLLCIIAMQRILPHFAKIDPRDNKVFVGTEELTSMVSSGKFQTDELGKWLSKVITEVLSDSFIRYHNGELAEEEVKAYASKNLLRNIKKMMEQTKSNEDSERVFRETNLLSKKIIEELIIKYPQSQAKTSTRKLKSVITRPDNSEMDEFDLIRFPSSLNISFQKKQDEQYGSQILKVLNQVMDVASQNLNKNKIHSLTNLQTFKILLENVLKNADDQKFKEMFFSKLMRNEKEFKKSLQIHSIVSEENKNQITQQTSQEYEKMIKQLLQVHQHIEEQTKLNKESLKTQFLEKIIQLYLDKKIHKEQIIQLLSYHDCPLQQQNKEINNSKLIFIQKIVNLYIKSLIDEQLMNQLIEIFEIIKSDKYINKREQNRRQIIDQIIILFSKNAITKEDMKQLLDNEAITHQKYLKIPQTTFINKLSKFQINQQQRKKLLILYSNLKNKSIFNTAQKQYSKKRPSITKVIELYQKTKITIQQLKILISLYQSRQAGQISGKLESMKRSQSQNNVILKINQKISTNIAKFTEQEIQAGTFRVPDASVLRVMTKWASQLRKKLKDCKNYLQKRVQPFKTHDGTLIQLKSQQRHYLSQAAKQQQKRIQEIYKELKQKHYQLGTKLSVDKKKVLYGDQQEVNISIFAARQQTSIGKYIFIYLNQLITSLIRVPIKAVEHYRKYLTEENNKKGYQHFKVEQEASKLQKQKFSKINLISLKIGDLMRAHFKSSQSQIIKIYEMMIEIGTKCPQLLRIVQLKDKLGEKDNNLLINVFFMNKIQCEIQMSVTEKIDPKQEHFNSFNHFIYQLDRAQFGPIAECACILAKYDPMTKALSKKQQLMPDNQKIKSNKQIKQSKIVNSPFLCQKCKKFQRNNNSHFFKGKKQQERQITCNNCYQQQLKDDQLIEQLFGKQKKDQFGKIFEKIKINKLADLQQYGIFFSRNANKLLPQYYELVKFLDQILVVNTNTKNQANIICSIDKQSQQSFKKAKKILDSYIWIKTKKNNKLEKKNNQNRLVLAINNQNNQNIQILSIDMEWNLISKQVIKIKNKVLISEVYKKEKEILYLQKRQITNQISHSIKQPTNNIKFLYASNNRIQKLQFLKKMPKLETIDLSFNIISKINNIQNFKYLKKLNLSNNTIIKIQVIQKLKNLTFLNLDNNQIQQIQGLQELKNLTFLNLDNNQIQKIQGLQELKYLASLSLGSQYYLGNSGITKIQGLQELKNLTSLYLNNNEILKIQGLEELKNLTSLYLNNNGILKIQGLQELKNLTSLYLNNNKILKIQGLQELKNLTQLHLNNNGILKIQGLQELKNLTLLNLNRNKIDRIYGLEKFKNLNQLDLQNNKIVKIQRLQELKNLTSLFLKNNKIQKIQGLQELKNLTSLNLNYNQIQKIQGLQELKNLTSLNLSNNAIKKIQGLQKLKNLTSLYLNYNRIQKIQGLQELKNLTSLTLNNNEIIKIQGLKGLKNLNSLNLYHTQIQKIQGLQDLINLNSLNLFDNKISKIQGLKDLKNLTSLNLNSNAIQKIYGLQELKNLTLLNLYNNKILTIQGLQNLKNLNSLYLSNNGIQKIQGLQELKNLTSLHLNNNKILKIQGLQELKNLTQLYLNNNGIQKLKGLEYILELKKLEIRYTNITKTQQNVQDIKKLQSKGVVINFDLILLSENKWQSLHQCPNKHNLVYCSMNGPYKCNKCFNSRDSNVRWVCNECNYQSCCWCDGFSTKTCPQGDQLEQIDEKYQIHKCDICCEEITERWNCKIHDFDLCKNCNVLK